MFRQWGREISSDPALERYGYALLIAHAITWLFYVDSGVLKVLHRSVEPVCWPFFEDCWRYRFSATSGVVLLLACYGALITGAAVALARGRIEVYQYLFVATNCGLMAVVALDYRLRANQVYMLLWLSAVFVLTSPRRWTLPIIIVSFYFWAGILKLDPDWLSGAGLYHELWLIPRDWYRAACLYVLVLETVVVWGLLAAGRVWVCITLIQLVAFHAQSLSQIHWFYPMLMVPILTWFVLPVRRKEGDATVVAWFAGRAPRQAYIVALVFAAFQFVPRLYPGDSSLTGQGRFFALHMFEARQVCEVHAVVRSGQPDARWVNIKADDYPPRMICDPVVYYNKVKNMCRSAHPDDQPIGFRMLARRSTQHAYTTLVDVSDFCDPRYTYSVLRSNDWFYLD